MDYVFRVYKDHVKPGSTVVLWALLVDLVGPERHGENSRDASSESMVNGHPCRASFDHPSHRI